MITAKEVRGRRDKVQQWRLWAIWGCFGPLVWEKQNDGEMKELGGFIGCSGQLEEKEEGWEGSVKDLEDEAGGASNSCWRKAFLLPLACYPTDSSLLPQFNLCLCVRRAGGHGQVVLQAAELMNPMVSWGISRVLHQILWCLIRCKYWSVFLCGHS